MKHLSLPRPLVSVEWLRLNINHPQLVLLDATIPKVGQKAPSPDAKVPGIKRARFFDIKKAFSDPTSSLPNTMPSAAQFTAAAQKIGLHTDSWLVIYDRHGMYSSPRAWWMFKTMGHEKVAVLDGGLPAWEKAGFSTNNLKKYKGDTGSFLAHYQKEKIVDSEEVLRRMADIDILVLDARSEGRFKGTAPEPRAELRGGHIPLSKSLPHTEVVKDGQMLDEAALKKIFTEKGVEDQELIFSCGSGITACVIALAAEKAGLQKKKIYDGSWTDWASNLALPVEK